MTEKEALESLQAVGALLQNDHFVYTSGRHGDSYVNKDALYPHTQLTSRLASGMAEPFVNSNVEVVVAPALGGIILSQWVAYHLSKETGMEVLSIYAEKAPEKNFVLKRGYDKRLKQKRVLVLEDILTTGGSLRKVIQLVQNLGGNIVGASVLCHRGDPNAKEPENIPELNCLVKLNFKSWEASKCPLCKKGIPINTTVGKG